LADQIGRAWEVEQIDALPLVRRVKKRGVHRMVVLPFFGFEVTGARARFDVALAARFPGSKQQRFGKGGLSARPSTSEQDVVYVSGPVSGHLGDLLPRWRLLQAQLAKTSIVT
jgi:hypothetical protein